MTEPDNPDGFPVVPALPAQGWAPPTGYSPIPTPVPGTIQAAVIVTWFCCAFGALATVGLTAMAAFLGRIVLPYFERADRVQMVAFVLASAAVVLLACAFASTCAWFVWRRRAWARLALAACSTLTFLASASFMSPPSLLVVPATVAVLVLLFLPRSNAWFRAHAAG